MCFLELIPDGLHYTRRDPTDKKARKADDRYIAFMSKYAQSLAGSKIVLRDVIVASKPSEKKVSMVSTNQLDLHTISYTTFLDDTFRAFSPL